MRGALLLLLLCFQEDPARVLRSDPWSGVDSLSEKGDAARSGLEKLVDDREVGFYARAALAEIDAAGAPGAGSLVRTKGLRDADSAEAVAALFKAAGLRFVAAGLPDRRVTVADGLPLLSALDALSAALDVEFYSDSAGTWHVTAGCLRAPRFAFRRFRVRADRVVQQVRADFERAAAFTLQLRLRLGGDEGARLLGFVDPKLIEAVDDVGTDLRKGGSMTVQVLPEGHTATVDLAAPPATAARIVRLRFSVTAKLEKKRETARFERVLAAKEVEKTVGAVRVKLRGVSREGQSWRVDLESAGPIDDLALADEEGRSLTLESQTGGPTAYVLRFAAGREPSVFSLAVVTEVYTRPVYLELRDVPLP